MRHGRCLAFLALSGLLWTPLAARAERLPLKLYTTADGLAHDTVYKIVRDSRGFLWFCTFEGLSRFDGYTFTSYGVAEGLPTQVVRDLLETRDGHYWVATAAGLCRFNPNGIPRRGSTARAPQTAASPAMFDVYVPGRDRGSKVVTSLVQDRAGTIWCGTFGGLYRLEDTNGQIGFRYVPTQDGVTSLLEDRRGNLWLGLFRGISRLLPDGRMERYSDRPDWPHDSVQSLLEDRDGRLWAGTRQHGLWRLDSDPDRTQPVVARVYSTNDGLPADEIKGLFQASDGGLWAGSNHGLIRFIQTADGKDFRFRIYAEPEGLSYSSVYSLTEDRRGNLWLATGAGAARYARSGITAFTGADGFSETAAILNDRAGDLFVVGGPLAKNFISRFDGERFVAVQPTVPQAPSLGRVWRENQALLEDRTGEWWVATGHGLYRFPRADSLERVTRTTPKARYTTRDGLASNNVWSVFEDSRGDIWIATTGGLSRWERAADTLHHYDAQDGWLWRDSPASFGEDRAGAIWIGMSIGGGLVRYRKGRFTRFTAADGLAEGGTLSLFFDSSGRLWVPMSPGGVFRIDNVEAERPTIVPYTTAQGLAGNDVEAVTEDRRGRIYLASSRGIDRLDPVTSHVRHYTATEGAIHGGVGSALQARDGALWFRYVNGLVRLVPEPDVAPAPASVLITGLRISGETQPVSALGETELSPLELPANRNQVQIDFVAPGFSPGEGSRYQYKLEGTAGDWMAAGEQRTVNFAHLAPGTYRFLVRTISAEGVVSSAPASFAFTISPPIWKRWWFEALVAAVLILGTFAVHRYRVSRLLELERVRTRIAADLHDDIGASLSRVAIMSEVLKRRLPGSASAPMLAEIADSAREVVGSMRDIVWAIDPRRDEVDDVVFRIRTFASDMLEAHGIKWSFHTPSEFGNMKLDADAKRHIVLFFKEAINNVVRHSKASEVRLDIQVAQNRLIGEVRDDGRGFTPVAEVIAGGQGLASMQRRVGHLRGTLVIDSSPGQGTHVRLMIPLARS